MSPEDLAEARVVHNRLVSAAEQGRQDRAARLRGDVDHYDLRQTRRSQLRKAVAYVTLQREARLTGRLDVDAWKAAQADLQDDGQPDWVFFLDHPRRRYRVRPWRPADGEPYTRSAPCITIVDAEEVRVLSGVPITGLHSFRVFDLVEDTDEHAAQWFAHATSRSRK